MKEQISVRDLVAEFKTNKIQNTKAAPNAVNDFLKNKLSIIAYVPFMDKQKIIDMVLEQSMHEEYGIKKVDSVGQFVGFLVAMIMAHTNLQFDENAVIDDYDSLCEAGLVEPIVDMFRKDYDEAGVLLKMVLAQKLEDNNLAAIVAKFLDGILDRLDGVGEVPKEAVGNIDLQKLIGTDFKEEDLAALKSLLDIFK